MQISNVKFEILEDGTITIETGDLSGPNHVSADKLLTELAEALGGPVTIKKRSKFAVSHDLTGALREHSHDGHIHQH